MLSKRITSPSPHRSHNPRHSKTPSASELSLIKMRHSFSSSHSNICGVGLATSWYRETHWCPTTMEAILSHNKRTNSPTIPKKKHHTNNVIIIIAMTLYTATHRQKQTTTHFSPHNTLCRPRSPRSRTYTTKQKTVLLTSPYIPTRDLHVCVLYLYREVATRRLRASHPFPFLDGGLAGRAGCRAGFHSKRVGDNAWSDHIVRDATKSIKDGRVDRRTLLSSRTLNETV